MKQIEISLNSPVFEQFNGNLDRAIQQCLSELYEGNFVAGDISAKINIELGSGMEVFAVGEDENGKPKEQAYHYKKPAIDFKVTLTLKKRDETKGSYVKDLELKRDDERFILSEVTRAQLTLEEMEVGT